MKKFIIISIMGILIVVFIGCGITNRLTSEQSRIKEEVKKPISQSIVSDGVVLYTNASMLDTYVICIDAWVAIPGAIVEAYSGITNDGFNPSSAKHLATSLPVIENGTFQALNIGSDTSIETVYLVQRENGKRASAPVILIK